MSLDLPRATSGTTETLDGPFAEKENRKWKQSKKMEFNRRHPSGTPSTISLERQILLGGEIK